MDARDRWKKRARLVEEGLRAIKRELLTKRSPLTYEESEKLEVIDELLAERR